MIDLEIYYYLCAVNAMAISIIHLNLHGYL